MSASALYVQKIKKIIIKLMTPTALPGVEIITATPANATKEWHQKLSHSKRSVFVNNIILGIVPHHRLRNMDALMQRLIARIRKLEYNTFVLTDCYSLYFIRIAKLYDSFITELTKKRELREQQKLQQQGLQGKQPAGSHDTLDPRNVAGNSQQPLNRLRRFKIVSLPANLMSGIQLRQMPTKIKLRRLNPSRTRVKMTGPEMIKVVASSSLLEPRKLRILGELKMITRLLATMTKKHEMSPETKAALDEEAKRLESEVVTNEQITAHSDFYTELQNAQDLLKDLDILSE